MQTKDCSPLSICCNSGAAFAFPIMPQTPRKSCGTFQDTMFSQMPHSERRPLSIRTVVGMTASQSLWFTNSANSSLDPARDEIQQRGGRVTQVLTNRVFVAETDSTTGSLMESTNVEPNDLDPVSLIVASAWKRSQAAATKKKKHLHQQRCCGQNQETPPMQWGESGILAPAKLDH